MQTSPDLRGKLKPPTFDLLCLFCFRSSHTGHEFLTDETVLDPQSEAHVATIFFKAWPQEHFFSTRG